MEQAMLSAQAANTNQICELEKHLASITSELQKVRQQLTNAPHNKPHGKPADNATPAAPPATPHMTTPAAACPQKPLDIWGNPTKNLTWAECLNASVSQQQDKLFMTITCKNKKPAPTTILPKALPRIEREVLLTCNAHFTKVEDKAKWATYVLNKINHIINTRTDITLPPFILTQITVNNRLVLTTNPTTPATAYKSYLLMVFTEINILQPSDPCVNGRWTKFLVHNVPTSAKLPDIKTEIETTYPSLHLATEPRWLVPAERHLNKNSSTIVISLIRATDLKHLGTTSLTICNYLCRINAYFAWSPATHCYHCQGYRYHTKLCKADKPTCAMCAQQHTTHDHFCPISTCRTRGACIHPAFKCTTCSAAHKANDPQCLVRIKHLTAALDTIEPTPQDETMESQV
jgi:hypothetical protein